MSNRGITLAAGICFLSLVGPAAFSQSTEQTSPSSPTNDSLANNSFSSGRPAASPPDEFGEILMNGWKLEMLGGAGLCVALAGVYGINRLLESRRGKSSSSD